MNQVVVELRKLFKAEQALHATKSVLQREAIAIRHRGKVKMKEGDYEGAVEEFCKANAVYTNDPDTIKYQGVAKLFLGDFQRAAEDLSVANELQPNDPFTLQQLCVIKFHSKGLEAVLGDIQRINQLDSSKDEETIVWQRLNMVTALHESVHVIPTTMMLHFTEEELLKVIPCQLIPYNEIHSLQEIGYGNCHAYYMAEWGTRIVVLRWRYICQKLQGIETKMAV